MVSLQYMLFVSLIKYLPAACYRKVMAVAQLLGSCSAPRSLVHTHPHGGKDAIKVITKHVLSEV